MFILNKHLVKDTGTTAHQNNCHKAYNNPICQFGEAVLADTRYLVNYKLRQRNLDQKIKGIWIGKDPTTDEHLIALPPIYDNHPSVTGSVYKRRGITRLPRPNMWDTTFLATIQWPPMESMDYIEPDVSENYKYLQEHNTSTREQLAQQPPQFQPVQEQQHQPQRQRREVVPKVPPEEPLGTTTKALPLRPPPGLEQVPAQPPLGTTSTAPPVKAPPTAPPPKPAQPQPVDGPQQHRPVGKHYNRPRPQQAGAVLQQSTDNIDNSDAEVDPYNCYNLTMETKVLHFAVNEDKKEKRLQQELMLDHAVPLPSYHYHDNIEQYDKQEVLTAMKKELDKLRQKDMYEECDKSTLTPEQLRKVVKTRWVVGDRPDPTTTATTGEVHASELRACFVAKGYSQYVDDPMVECYAATPSSASLKTLLLLGIHALTSLQPSSTHHYHLQKKSTSNHQQNGTTTPLQLYGASRRRCMDYVASPKLWQQHLGEVLRQQNLRQCKADRCLWTTPGLGVLIYVDDLLLVGEPTRIQHFITTLKAVEACDYSFKGGGCSLHTVLPKPS